MSTELETWTVTEPFLHINCNLGEGPHFEPATNTLRFVDIIEKALHTVSLTEGASSLKTLTLPFSIGSTADIEGVDPSKKILVGSKSGVGILDRETGELELLKKYYDGEDAIEKAEVLGDGVKEERMRGNDGSVDPQGRFWIGTMTDFWVGEVFDEGTLFRFDSDLSRHSLVHPVKIPNSIGWSVDHKTLFFTHSTSRVILAYDYTPETGEITNGRPFYNHEGPGEPDGFKVDVEGNLWSAVYGESRVLKINNEGKLVGQIMFPAKCMTCPVFVGTELYVTSASGGRESEFAGDIFKFDVGVKGVEPFQFKIEEGVSMTLKV